MYLHDGDVIQDGLHYIYFEKQDDKLKAYNNYSSEAPIEDFSQLMNSYYDEANHEGRFVSGWVLK